MRIRRVSAALAMLLGTAILAVSCITVDKTVGSDYIPDNHKLKLRTASIKLPVRLKSADSLQGVANTYMTLGSFNTDEFGTARFGSAANICPTSTTLNLGKDRKIISTYLQLSLAAKSDYSTIAGTSIVLDKSQKNIGQTFSIHRLNKYLDTSSVYVCDIKESDYDPTPLNTHEIAYFGGDSIKIYLDNSFGEEILSATEDELDSLTLFMKNHRGLYIKSDYPLAGLNSGRLNLFSRASSSIYVKFNFQPTWCDTVGRKDTLIPIMFGDSYCVNTAEHQTQYTYNGEELERIPIEGIAGLTPYISATDLKDAIEAWKAENGYENAKILVAKATINLPYPEPENSDDFTYKYPKYIFPNHRLRLSDTSLIKYYYPFGDYESTGNPLGAINRSLSKYVCDFSETTQKFISKDKESLNSSFDIWLRPIYSETNSTYGTVNYYTDLYVYYMGYINGPKAERYPTLDFIYTIVEQ